ncbi:MAG: hypothetical protein ABFE08_07370 [Armatimonadia bacterium]
MSKSIGSDRKGGLQGSLCFASPPRRRCAWLPAVLVGLVFMSCSASFAFKNTVNRRFATRANGPLGAIVMTHQKSTAYRSTTRRKALLAQHHPNRLRRAASSYRRMLKYRPTRHAGSVRFPRTLVEVNGAGAMTQPNLLTTRQTRARVGDAGNNLTFEFQGWSTADATALQAYLNTAYPKAKSIYGPPAFNMTVKIIQDTTIDSIQGGIYDAANNEIRMPALTGNFPEDTYILLMLVLNAFHDDAIFYYDAWEQGFIGAAAYAIQTQSGISPGYDPIDPGPFYCLSVYEAENQPELGNSTFYPASGSTNMMVWRIAMARAAWLKCWIEKPTFFSEVNQRYYARYTTDLAGDIPTLKEIVAQVVPKVEGIPFAEWYQQQYVLDTSIRVSQKLYTWNIPLPDSVMLITELYQTTATGDETPLGGTAETHYWDDTYTIDQYAEEGNIITIPAGGSTPGEGFLVPTFYTIGGAQRMTVQIDVNDLRRYYPYPYGLRGFELGENNFYGAIVGGQTGTIDVTGGNGITGLAVSRGVFGSRVTTAALRPMQVAVTYTSSSNQKQTRLVNIGWDSYVCFLNTGNQVEASHTFTYGQNGLHLMSLPAQPLETDASVVLGVPMGELLLAWWDALSPGDSKYKLWPSFRFHTPGNAYWWRVPSDTTVSFTGLQTDPATTYEVPLGAGWNLLGNPRLTSVPLSDVKVRFGANEPVSWSEAVNQRYMQDTLYSYSQTAGYELKDTLEPWAGYWVRCLMSNGVTLIFPAVETE